MKTVVVLVRNVQRSPYRPVQLKYAEHQQRNQARIIVWINSLIMEICENHRNVFEEGQTTTEYFNLSSLLPERLQ